MNIEVVSRPKQQCEIDREVEVRAALHKSAVYWLCPSCEESWALGIGLRPCRTCREIHRVEFDPLIHSTPYRVRVVA